MTGGDSFQEKETVRLETFSDGVFSILITLLTFELKIPDLKEAYTSQQLLFALLERWPVYIAFLLSFSTIFVIWVNHHRMYNVIRRSDGRFMYYNGLLLLLTSLIPFTTNLLARYIQTSATELAAALTMTLYGSIVGVFYLMWNHATTDYKLLKRPAANVRIKLVRNGYIISMAVYGVSALLATVMPPVSLLIGGLMVIYLSRLKYHRQRVV